MSQRKSLGRWRLAALAISLTLGLAGCGDPEAEQAASEAAAEESAKAEADALIEAFCPEGEMLLWNETDGYTTFACETQSTSGTRHAFLKLFETRGDFELAISNHCNSGYGHTVVGPYWIGSQLPTAVARDLINLGGQSC